MFLLILSIATAAYGSALDSHVVSLRQFRDNFLLTNAPGRAFVDLYYANSPPVAAWIAKHDAARSIVRLALWPVVMTVENPALVLSALLAGAVTLKAQKLL